MIGTSAGGVETLPKVLAEMPDTFGGSIFVVLHISPTCTSVLPQILQRASNLPALHPHDGETIKKGHIYVAPPDFHLWLSESCIRVTRGPRINRHRPAVDPLFETAAHNYGPRTVGVVLTGALDDGTVGLEAIRSCGGVTVVQDPTEAAVPSMPESALRNVKVDHCLTVAEIRELLVRLSTKKLGNLKFNCPEPMKFKVDDPSMNVQEMEGRFGVPTAFICPECNGPLWEAKKGRTKTFKCLVGHAFSPDSLLAEDGEAVERALWVAVKTLQERASLLRNLAEGYKKNGTTGLFEDRAREAEEQASVIRKLLVKWPG